MGRGGNRRWQGRRNRKQGQSRIGALAITGLAMRYTPERENIQSY